MTQITGTNREFLELLKGLEAIKAVQGKAFAILAARNIASLSEHLRPIDTVARPSLEFQQVSAKAHKMAEAEDAESKDAKLKPKAIGVPLPKAAILKTKTIKKKIKKKTVKPEIKKLRQFAKIIKNSKDTLDAGNDSAKQELLFKFGIKDSKDPEQSLRDKLKQLSDELEMRINTVISKQDIDEQDKTELRILLKTLL